MLIVLCINSIVAYVFSVLSFVIFATSQVKITEGIRLINCEIWRKRKIILWPVLKVALAISWRVCLIIIIFAYIKCAHV